MSNEMSKSWHSRVALLAEGVDRNRWRRLSFPLSLMSPSSRRAWIEISGSRRAGSRSSVALLAEGVDRNVTRSSEVQREAIVALLAEGVDRNTALPVASVASSSSPSSRRAWIEIAPVILFFVVFWDVALLAEGVDRNDNRFDSATGNDFVALLAEGVDRNERDVEVNLVCLRSPSSRRAWIEIPDSCRRRCARHGRPPRGGRG